MEYPGCTLLYSSKVTTQTRPIEVPLGVQLCPAQRQKQPESVYRNQVVFSSESGHTKLVHHHIITKPGTKVV